MAHNQAQSQASRAQQLAAKTLRVIEWLNKSGIPREQFTVRQREAWDAIAKEGA
jgi:hypothetical protein